VAEFNALMRDARIVPPVEPNALLQPPTQADAWTHNVQAVRSMLNVTPEQVQDFIAPAPNTTYGSVLPYAKDNETGDVRVAMPSIVRDSVQALYDLSQGPHTGVVTPEATLGLVGMSGPALLARPGVNALLQSGPGFKASPPMTPKLLPAMRAGEQRVTGVNHQALERDYPDIAGNPGSELGFVNPAGRWLTRQQAFQYALEHGLIDPKRAAEAQRFKDAMEESGNQRNLFLPSEWLKKYGIAGLMAGGGAAAAAGDTQPTQR